MEEKLNRISAIQEGKLVRLCFPSSAPQTYSFEKEEEAEQFVINCNRLEQFMEGIVPEEKFDVSFKQLLSEYIMEEHVPVISMEEEDFDSLETNWFT